MDHRGDDDMVVDSETTFMILSASPADESDEFTSGQVRWRKNWSRAVLFFKGVGGGSHNDVAFFGE